VRPLSVAAVLAFAILLLLAACSKEPLGPVASSGPATVAADSSTGEASDPSGGGGSPAAADSLPARGTIPTVTEGRPEEVLEMLGRAYSTRDIGLLDRCLASDFKFYASINSPSGLCAGATWGREQEIAIHRNMFDPTFHGIDSVPGATTMAVAFRILNDKQVAGAPSDLWEIRCAVHWYHLNSIAGSRPHGICASGETVFLVRRDAKTPDRWLIWRWWDGPARVTRL
jgi:hypothetical protein